MVEIYQTQPADPFTMFLGWLPYIVVVVVALVVLFLTVFTVEQQSAAVVQRFGKFLRTANAGLNFKIPIVD